MNSVSKEENAAVSARSMYLQTLTAAAKAMTASARHHLAAGICSDRLKNAPRSFLMLFSLLSYPVKGFPP